MDYVIRPLTTADEPLLWDMLYAAVQAGEGVTEESREVVHQPQLARHVEGWGRPGDVGFVAHDRDDGKPLGAAWLRASATPSAEEQQSGTPELAFAVKREHRRQGIGAALLTQLVKANPQHSTVAVAAPSTNPVVRLYERFGFKVVQQGPHSVTMRREV